MEVLAIRRKFEFKVNSQTIELEDVNADMSPEEVKDFYAIHYPQLMNASIGEPIMNEENQLAYEFIPIAGTKG